MAIRFKHSSPRSSDFFDTTFEDLMLSRVGKVLLVCSRYDTFILEEDGRIEDQLFNEYTALKLRNSPQFVFARTSFAALDAVRNQEIDLAILMDSAAGMSSVELAQRIRKEKPNVPLVSLTPFQRYHRQIKNADFVSDPFDYQFQWLGQADILLAIVKLIEDKLNAEHDIHEVGAQAILLVEDSVHFTSVLLPLMYKLLFKQSLRFMTEGLNEHQQMLRLRGRPKVLWAKTFEEALIYYERYKHNLLGVLSDVEFLNAGLKDEMAGFHLFEKVNIDSPYLPFILQSSESVNRKPASELGIGFIDKNSDDLAGDIDRHCLSQLGFGDFIFRNPGDMVELDRAGGLKELQQKLLNIPDDSMSWHLSRNDISRWLKANALFKLAAHFQFVHLSDLPDLAAARRYIHDTISAFRMYELRGRVARFDRHHFDNYFLFSRIGEGSLGGKARGLAYLDEMLWEQGDTGFLNVSVRIPRTLVLSTEVFDQFIMMNDLGDLAHSNSPDHEILRLFTQCDLPTEVLEDLKAFASVIDCPLAVRSSSLLEDSLHQPFAGIYSTYMLPFVKDQDLALENLCWAVKAVFASTFSESARSYMAATSIKISDEKMAVILQEVVGSDNKGYFYPSISGVARSLNYYPVGVEKAEDGVALLAIGLGRYVVGGGLSLRFSPAHPKNVLQLAAPQKALNETQKTFLAIRTDMRKMSEAEHEASNIEELSVKDANPVLLRRVASTFDQQSMKLYEGSTGEGIKVITFNKILNYDSIPLPDIIRHYLKVCAEAFNHPVEIEFALELGRNEQDESVFFLLQVRPMLIDKEEVQREEIPPAEKLFALSKTVLGNGIKYVKDVVYAKPDAFDSLKTREMAHSIDLINAKLREAGKRYILAAPGRWGSSDPNLGIPVNWPQISNACLLIETHLDKYRIEPSQGTHFFHNLTTMNVGYFSITPYHDGSFVNFDMLADGNVLYEDHFIKHVELSEPLKLSMNAREGVGFISL